MSIAQAEAAHAFQSSNCVPFAKPARTASPANLKVVSSAQPALAEVTEVDTSVKVTALPHDELIIRCQQNARPNRAAFAELVRRYQAHVEKLLYHLAPDWTDRSDLAQEVWIRVYRNIRRLQEPAKFKGWLGRITTNLFYDELRKRKKHAGTLSLDAPRYLDDDNVDWEIASDEPGPVDNMLTQEFYECLQAAIEELPEVFRTTIVLREIQGLAYEEIAEITGATLGTVKSRIARARGRLQESLQQYLNGKAH
jgi:RNA polymerase sigma-70 factor, ECF subfamily